MPRYIDADELQLRINLHGTNKFGMLDENIREFINNQPTVEQCSELAELKTKLENGTLVELPCKVGDKVKVLCDSWGNVWNYKTIDYGKFLVGEIISITITKKQVLMKIQAGHNVEWKRERRRYPISALGKTVFLTLADAENKLNEGVE